MAQPVMPVELKQTQTFAIRVFVENEEDLQDIADFLKPNHALHSVDISRSVKEWLGTRIRILSDTHSPLECRPGDYLVKWRDPLRTTEVWEFKVVNREEFEKLYTLVGALV